MSNFNCRDQIPIDSFSLFDRLFYFNFNTNPTTPTTTLLLSDNKVERKKEKKDTNDTSQKYTNKYINK